MAKDGDLTSGSGGEPQRKRDPLAAMTSLGRSPETSSRPQTKPTGAAAFVAREKAGGGGRTSLAVVGLAVAGATAVAAASFGAWAIGGGNDETSRAPVARTAAVPAPDGRAEAERLVAMDKERQRKADEIAESKKQLDALQARRDALQKQVAELTGPLSPDLDEANAAPAMPAPPTPPVKGAEARPGSGEAEAADPPPDTDTDTAALASETPAQPNDAAAHGAKGAVRVFIHVRAGDPDALARAEAIADELRRQGVEVAGIRGVPRAVRNDMVRFFYDADQSAASTLGRAVADAPSGHRNGPPITQDFRNRQVAPKPGTLEIWLS